MSIFDKLKTARTEKKLLKDVEKIAFDEKYKFLETQKKKQKADDFSKRVEDAKLKGSKRAQVKSETSTKDSVVKTAKTIDKYSKSFIKSAGQFAESLDKVVDEMVDEPKPKKKSKKK